MRLRFSESDNDDDNLTFGGKVNALVVKKKLPPEGGSHQLTTINV
mgnify:FL=1